jgi:hypothetical protein
MPALCSAKPHAFVLPGETWRGAEIICKGWRRNDDVPRWNGFGAPAERDLSGAHTFIEKHADPDSFWPSKRPSGA